MADNIPITPGSGADVATDDVSGNHYQRMKISDGVADSAVHLNIVAEDAASSGGETGILAMGIRKDVPAALGADLDFTYPQFDSRGAQWTHPIGSFVTRTTDVTRAANTTTYTLGDNFGSTPSGGYTVTDAARESGGSGIITDIWITFEEDAADPLQGDIRIFDSAFTEVADNAAWAESDADAKLCIGTAPFALTDNGNQGIAHLTNLNIGFTCVGTADLRFAVRARNGYIPTTNSSILSVRVKILQVT